MFSAQMDTGDMKDEGFHLGMKSTFDENGHIHLIFDRQGDGKISYLIYDWSYDVNIKS